MTATKRVRMRDRVQIGQDWQRKRDRLVYQVRQVHRADRQAEMRSPNGRVELVPFERLRRQWEQVP